MNDSYTISTFFYNITTNKQPIFKIWLFQITIILFTIKPILSINTKVGVDSSIVNIVTSIIFNYIYMLNFWSN